MDKPNLSTPSTDLPAPLGPVSVDVSAQLATHGVFYADGGCRPSRGIGGYGVHGYTFIDTPAKQGTGCKNALPTKKGYVMGKTGIPPITVTNYVDALGSLIPESTNNIAELTALNKCYEIIQKFSLTDVLLRLDSEYVLKGIKKVERWEAANWTRYDGGPVANDGIWRYLLKTKRYLTDKGVAIKYEWVEGHSGDLGNDTADELATKGVAAGKNQLNLDAIVVSPAKGYWTTRPEVNRLFSLPNWYFNSKNGNHDPDRGVWTYHLGAPREDDELMGRKMVDATYSVVQLYEADPLLEMIRKAHGETDFLEHGSPAQARLSEIFSKDVMSDLMRFGDKILRKDFHNGHMYYPLPKDPVGILLTKDIRPPRLAFNAMDSLQLLEAVLINHLDKPANSQQVSTDISTLLYETVQEGKKKPVFRLKPTITQTERTLPVTVSYRKVDGSLGETELKLTLGHDLPDRNTLAALVDQEPKVSVVAWPESPVAVRYATVVETTKGRGIWSAIYSNLQLVK